MRTQASGYLLIVRQKDGERLHRNVSFHGFICTLAEVKQRGYTGTSETRIWEAVIESCVLGGGNIS